MFFAKDYTTVHKRALDNFSGEIDTRLKEGTTVFSTHQTMIADGEPAEVYSYYDPLFYSEEDVALEEARARIAGLGLASMLAMHRIVSGDVADMDTEAPQPLAIDDLVSKSDYLLIGNGVMRLHVVEVSSGTSHGVMHSSNLVLEGIMESLRVIRIDDDIAIVREEISLQADPEIERVLGFLLPHLSAPQTAILLRTLSGNVHNPERSASKLVAPFHGTSLEEEAIRILDMVVDRCYARIQARDVQVEGLTVPDAEKLDLWVDRVS